MELSRVAAPTDQVVGLERAKQHLNVDSSHHDAKITGLIAAATARLDGDRGLLGRCLMPQTWLGTMAGFPCYAIELPLPPTLDVLSLKYLDGGGIEQTLSDAAYRLVAGGSGVTRIVPNHGRSWPQTACELDAVRITFRGGFAPSAPEVEPVRVAILMMVEHWYEPEGVGMPIPEAAMDLVSDLRLAPL